MAIYSPLEFVRLTGIQGLSGNVDAARRQLAYLESVLGPVLASRDGHGAAYARYSDRDIAQFRAGRDALKDFLAGTARFTSYAGATEAQRAAAFLAEVAGSHGFVSAPVVSKAAGPGPLVVKSLVGSDVVAYAKAHPVQVVGAGLGVLAAVVLVVVLVARGE